VVFDPADTLACMRLVAGLADLDTGRAVCHPTPADPAGTWLGVDLLVALGKRLDAPTLERSSTRAWPLAGVWLRAEPIGDLLVLRAHLLTPRALGRLVVLGQHCGVRLWLIVHRPALRAAQRRTLDQTGWQTMGIADLHRRWPTAVHQPDPPPPTGDDDGFPAVPGADFLVFRAACRRLLDPDSFAQVDRCYRDTMHQLLAWLADRTSLLQTMHRAGLAARRDPIWPDGGEPSSIRVDRDRARQSLALAWDSFTTLVAGRLVALTTTDHAPAQTLVRLRAAQAAFLRYGLLLNLDPTMLAMAGHRDGRPTLTPQVATRLRGCCTPRYTAAAALALATGADAADLAGLHLGDLTGDAAVVRLDGQALPIPTHARSLVRALLIQRRDQHANANAYLFAGRAPGRRASDDTIRRLLEQATLHAGVAIPGTRNVHRPAAWFAQHGLTLTRLPVPPPTLAPS
jgi:integrase